MAKQVLTIVSGMGLGLSILQGLVKAVLDAGGTDEDIHRLATPEGEKILGKVAEIIVGSVRKTFKVIVDYTKSLGEMIRDGGYDYADSDITPENFPVSGKGKQETEIALFHFNKRMESEEVIVEMKKAGYRPASLAELLALGAAYPDLQRQYPIVVLGSIWRSPDGSRRVPCLCRGGAGRLLGLSWLGLGWSEHCRFAAVRNA